MRPTTTLCLALAAAIFAGACQAQDVTPLSAPAPPSAVEAPPAAPSATEQVSDATPTPSAAPTPTAPAVVRAPFDAQAAVDFATRLAAMGTRDAGTPGDVAAQAVITDALLAAGWLIEEDIVPLPQGGSTVNIVAMRRPTDRQGSHIVVGGHHDTRGGSPGANDNASGIGVLVALAAELDDEADAMPTPIVLVAFGAEEYQPSQPREHHLGSEHYADAYDGLVEQALVIDMVANGASTCVCWLDGAPRTLADRLLAVAQDQDIRPVHGEARGDISDHGPFALRGVPAAFLWSGPDGRLHTPADTAEHLDVEDARRAGDLALAFLRSLALPEAEASPAAS